MAMGEDGHMDPLEAARRIKQYLNRLIEGQIRERAVELWLNHLYDIMILRNRLERYEMRQILRARSGPVESRARRA